MSALICYKEYPIAFGAEPIRLELVIPSAVAIRSALQLRIRIKDTDAMFKLGGENVVAENTIGGDGGYIDRNFTVAAGIVELFGVNNDASHLSIMALDGVTEGKAFITLGTGE